MGDCKRDGLKKKRIIFIKNINGQSAAKHVGDNMKVQRLVGVISR